MFFTTIYSDLIFILETIDLWDISFHLWAKLDYCANLIKLEILDLRFDYTLFEIWPQLLAIWEFAQANMLSRLETKVFFIFCELVTIIMVDWFTLLLLGIVGRSL